MLGRESLVPTGGCDACTKDKTCKQWIYAPAAQGKHPKGACWLMAVAGLPRKSANRISGGASPHVPPHSSGSGECVVPLERSGLGPVSISSVKYWIAIPWIFNLDGWGVFLNQPGDGMMDASSGLKATFTCQKQLDLWVTAAPTAAPNRFPAVFNSCAHATGLPSPLPDNGALYWQSRDASLCVPLLAEPEQEPGGGHRHCQELHGTEPLGWRHRDRSRASRCASVLPIGPGEISGCRSHVQASGSADRRGSDAESQADVCHEL